jgi:23S rRNA pseudouridine1911/1915/1917 synthase
LHSEYNRGFAYEEHVGPRLVGRSVLEYLAERYRHSTATEWERRIRSGEVRLDGRRALPADRLRAGQCLIWNRPPWREPAVPLDFALLYADADVLAVAKPRGLPTMPAGGFLTHTLFSEVRRRFSDAAPVHRLGRGTSGVVLFARSAHARRSLGRAWRDGRVERIYLGLVQGRFDRGRFTIELPIGPVPHPLLGTVYGACAGGRAARTVVRTLRVDDQASLVAVRIDSGRPHQIRIHLAAAGRPLVGEPLYGRGGLPRPHSRALPGDGGYLLHAARLVFPHPTSGAMTTIECAPPPALRALACDGRRAPYHHVTFADGARPAACSDGSSPSTTASSG